MQSFAGLVIIVFVAPLPAGGMTPALPVIVTPVALVSDTVPGDSGHGVLGGYTGIRSGYRQTARIVGNTVVDPSDPMVRVFAVEKDSPAERAGLAEGDLILEIDGVTLHSDTVLSHLTPGANVVLRILRGRDEMEVTLVPGPPRPAPPWRPRS
jgi:S1-C subfamily serine protease